MWIRVNSQGATDEYVDLDRVVRIVFTVSGETQQFSSALLYAIGGTGFVSLGSVTGEASLRKLQEHVGLIRNKDVVI
jgi:hypothetical protein